MASGCSKPIIKEAREMGIVITTMNTDLPDLVQNLQDIILVNNLIKHLSGVSLKIAGVEDMGVEVE